MSGTVKQLFRVPLAHSPLPADADICLIVPDVKGIPNKEHERHLEHYENLLNSKDVAGIKKIMTFHEFRTEYDTFELKNRLVDLYDIFLVDGKISGKVVRKCGSIFYKKRKVPLSVKLHLPKLKSHLENSLKKTFFHLNLKSDSSIVQIGHNKMKVNDLVENVYSVVEFIERQYPGKMDNIRSLNVYAHRGSSIPVYVSFKNPNEVEVPKLNKKKPKAYKTFKGELSTKINANVIVKPSGEVIVQRNKINRRFVKENLENEAEITNEGKTETKRGKKRKLSKETKPTDPEKKPKITPSKENVIKVEQKKKKSADGTAQLKLEANTQKTKKKEKTLEKVTSKKVIKPKLKKKKMSQL